MTGDSDAPESHWVVGESSEMFNYKLLGVHKVSSGFTCIVNAPDAKPGQVRCFPRPSQYSMHTGSCSHVS